MIMSRIFQKNLPPYKFEMNSDKLSNEPGENIKKECVSKRLF